MKYYLFSLSLFMLFSACVYEPERFVEPDDPNRVVSKMDASWGHLYTINEGYQICNPSVSQDSVNYPASMLWLNFGGFLKVRAPDSVYTVSDVEQHDRLTVSDTAGQVLWYLMIDTAKHDCQFQDPEWSTHPNYIVALRAYDVDGRSACENLDYGLFAVRMSDKKKFWFYDKDISEFATPHLWVNQESVEDSAKVESDSTVKGFFGTEDVRLVYVDKNDRIVFVDFSAGGNGKEKLLKKPSGLDSWMMDSPMISPDGKFVAYNMIQSSMTGWKSFVQELSDKSTPVEIEKTEGMISNPVQPHWYKADSHLYVVWTEFPQGKQFVNKENLFSESVHERSAGRTAMREISIAEEGKSIKWVGKVVELAPIPLIGGRSPDGHFVATGANNGYVLELP